MITGIILASGFSKRMKEEKLLLKLEGIPLVERVIRATQTSHLDELILIYRRDEIKEIAKKYGLKTVYNPHADEGQSRAIKLGVQSSHPDTEGFMFLVGDQANLDSITINKLIAIFKEGKSTVVIPLYKDKRGNPVIFSSKLKGELLAIEGDYGGKVIYERMIDNIKLVTIDKSMVGVDIDTKKEFEKIKRI